VVTDLLKTKLTIVDKRCEGGVRAEIDKFYSEARYDGSRFRAPSIQDVANALLQSISCKEREFNAEICRVMATTQRSLNDKDFEDAQRLVEGFLDERHYGGRLNAFVEGIKRKAASYGVPFDPANYRVDLAAVLYETGVKDLLRQSRASVIAELALHRRHHEERPAGPKSPAAALKAFWLAHWQWVIGTLLAVVGIIASLM
jgi:hypothetical protein